MITAAFALLNANKAIVGYVALVLLGVTIVSGSYISGQRAERNKQAAEIAKVNAPIIEQRGKDEAELAAQEEAAKRIDAAVKAELELKKNERFILDPDTAKLLGAVK